MTEAARSVVGSHDLSTEIGLPHWMPLRVFDQFVSEHQDMVYNLAYRMLGDSHLAATVTQDAFTTSFPFSARFHGKAARLWLTQITTSICYERLRRGERGHRAWPPHGDTSQRLLSALPLDQRVAVILSDLQGLTYHEIAQVLGVSTDVVRSRLSQGRAALRDALLLRGEIRS